MPGKAIRFLDIVIWCQPPQGYLLDQMGIEHAFHSDQEALTIFNRCKSNNYRPLFESRISQSFVCSKPVLVAYT